MVQRYSPQGAMFQSTSGMYVALSDYEKLDRALTHVLQTAGTCFKQMEASEITARDAEAALEVCATFAKA